MAPDQSNIAVRRKNVPVIGRQEEKEPKQGNSKVVVLILIMLISCLDYLEGLTVPL